MTPPTRRRPRATPASWCEEEKVDVLIGTSGVPGTVAMAVVAAETKTPMISLTPASQPASPNGQWLISIPQPPPLMVAAVVERMKKDNVKKSRLYRLQRFLGRSRL